MELLHENIQYRKKKETRDDAHSQAFQPTTPTQLFPASEHIGTLHEPRHAPSVRDVFLHLEMKADLVSMTMMNVKLTISFACGSLLVS